MLFLPQMKCGIRKRLPFMHFSNSPGDLGPICLQVSIKGSDAKRLFTFRDISSAFYKGSRGNFIDHISISTKTKS